MMGLDYTHIGKNMRKERKAAGLTQAALADFTDSSPQYISHIENGRKKASLEILVRVANVLNISMDRLLGHNINNNQAECDILFQQLLSDCSSYERQIIVDVARALQVALKENRRNLLGN